MTDFVSIPSMDTDVVNAITFINDSEVKSKMAILKYLSDNKPAIAHQIIIANKPQLVKLMGNKIWDTDILDIKQVADDASVKKMCKDMGWKCNVVEKVVTTITHEWEK